MSRGGVTRSYADWRAAVGPPGLPHQRLVGWTSATPQRLQVLVPRRVPCDVGLNSYVIASGSHCVFGDPDMVAAELARIASLSYDGLMINFVNYLDELPYFAQEVLPRLSKFGARTSSVGSDAP